MGLFGCKHKKVSRAFLKAPRFNQEAAIEYQYCEHCHKILKCKIKLVEAFQYPVVAPRPKPQPVVVKPRVVEVTPPAIVEKPRVVAPPAPAEETFVKKPAKRRNPGRRPSTTEAPAGTSLGGLAKAFFSEENPEQRAQEDNATQDVLKEVYGKFEDDSDDDDIGETVRLESPDEAESRFDRSRRKKLRRG